MEEMTLLTFEPRINIEGFYIRLRSLVHAYARLSLEGEDLEDFVSDVTEWLVFTRKIYELPHDGSVFWYYYIKKVVDGWLSERERNPIDARELSGILLEADPTVDPLSTDSKCFLRFKKTRVQQLLRSSTLRVVLQLAYSHDKAFGVFIEKDAKKQISAMDTSTLLSIYKKSLSTHRKEYKTCRKKLNQMFYRGAPSKR